MVLTDVAGMRLVRHGSADRGALPYGVVTPTDFRANPILSDEYDEDTITIRLTLPDARTLTVSVSGGGTWTYTPGNVLDDLTTETAFADGEVRGPYVIEHEGAGGVWAPFFRGPLHGATAGSTSPSVGAVNAVDGFFPGDGGGNFDVTWGESNMPSGTTFNIAGTITSGLTSGSPSFSASGVTSPHTFSLPLGPGTPTVDLVVTAMFNGVQIAIAAYSGGIGF